MLNMTKATKSANDRILRVQQLAKITAVLLIICAIAAYICSLRAYAHPFQDYPTSDVSYVLQNIGTTLIFIEIGLALILKNLHDGLYWFFWLQLKKVVPTPHEQHMRERVFERSYGYAVALAAVGLTIASGAARYGSIARNDLLSRIVWIVVVAMLSLPSILASLQKYEKQK